MKKSCIVFLCVLLLALSCFAQGCGAVQPEAAPAEQAQAQASQTSQVSQAPALPVFTRGSRSELAQLDGDFYWIAGDRLLRQSGADEQPAVAAEDERLTELRCLIGYEGKLYAVEMTGDNGLLEIDPQSGEIESVLELRALYPYFAIHNDMLYLAQNGEDGARLVTYSMKALDQEPQLLYEHEGPCLIDCPNWTYRGLVFSLQAQDEDGAQTIDVCLVDEGTGKMQTLVQNSAHYGGTPAVGSDSCLAVQKGSNGKFALVLCGTDGQERGRWEGYAYPPMVTYACGLYLVDEGYRPSAYGEMEADRELWTVDENGVRSEKTYALPGTPGRCLWSDGKTACFHSALGAEGPLLKVELS